MLSPCKAAKQDDSRTGSWAGRFTQEEKKKITSLSTATDKLRALRENMSQEVSRTFHPIGNLGMGFDTLHIKAMIPYKPNPRSGSSGLILLQSVFLVHLTLTSGAYLQQGAPGIVGRADAAFSDRPADLDRSRTLSTRVHGPQPMVNLMERTKTKSKRGYDPKLPFRIASDERYVRTRIDDDPTPEIPENPSSKPPGNPSSEPPDKEYWLEDDDYESLYEREKYLRWNEPVSTFKSEGSGLELASKAYDFFDKKDFKMQEMDVFTRPVTGGEDWLYVYYELRYHGSELNVRKRPDPEYPTHWIMDEPEDDEDGPIETVPDHFYEVIKEANLSRGGVKMTLGDYTWRAGFFTYHSEIEDDTNQGGNNQDSSSEDDGIQEGSSRKDDDSQESRGRYSDYYDSDTS
ncbi:MAG: hypothetical protein M1837_006133 [Sclerophora amabilis]|nr:MAG: hypothetical protein M1837_006133 [Sclerophora amabilis]